MTTTMSTTDRQIQELEAQRDRLMAALRQEQEARAAAEARLRGMLNFNNPADRAAADAAIARGEC